MEQDFLQYEGAGSIRLIIVSVILIFVSVYYWVKGKTPNKFQPVLNEKRSFYKIFLVRQIPKEQTNGTT